MTSIPRLLFGLLKYVRTYKEPLKYDRGYEIISQFLNSWFDYKINGRENIPQQNKFIACTNHASFLDMLVLSAAIYPARVSYLAKPEFFRYDEIMREKSKKHNLENYLGSILEKAGKIVTDHAIEWGAIKLQQKGLKISSLKYYTEQAQEKNIGIFPEGHRSTPKRKYNSKKKGLWAALTEPQTTETNLQKLRGLAANLMLRTGNPILPIGIKGNYNITPWFLFTKRAIEVNIGEPMYAADYTGKREVLKELEKRITNLINI
jgi:1-acyl-sn-glycerol-3-phosphate acyltransferase